MDCLFLLIWTLLIPLVGCTSAQLRFTLLYWNIIKACGTYIFMYTHFIQYHAPDPFRTQVNKLSGIIYFHNTAVAARLCHWLWWKSKTSTCQLILNSRRNSCFNKRSSIYQLRTSTSVNACNLLLPVHLFSSPSFFSADVAHLLLTHLPHRLGQLFFQREPRIKSRWVLVFWHPGMFLPAGLNPCL